MSPVYSDNKTDIVTIYPGETYFGNTAKWVNTILGSCVAIVLWHPQRKLTGLCHYVLPEMRSGADNLVPGRYAEGAIRFLFESVKRYQTSIIDYEVGIYGGGYLLGGNNHEYFDIGRKNAVIGLSLLKQAGITPREQKVGGRCYRTLKVNGLTGVITLFESNSEPKQVS